MYYKIREKGEEMEILFQDENIVVCIKEVGVDSEHQTPKLLKEQCGGDFFTVHRLDLNVGGVMVYARNKHTAAYFSKIVQDGQMIKEYLAEVEGQIENEGILEDYLFKDSRKNKVFVVKRMRKGVKAAKLAYKVLEYKEDKSLVLVRLYTGRSHQIRVQFSSRGFPLIGDHKYGSCAKDDCPHLYSCRLTFPYHKKEMVFEKMITW